MALSNNYSQGCKYNYLDNPSVGAHYESNNLVKHGAGIIVVPGLHVCRIVCHAWMFLWSDWERLFTKIALPWVAAKSRVNVVDSREVG